jgi:HPt (histidine-containing phosphotransfer) domain-containing protein
MAEMDEAFRAKDFSKLARMAHNLKGVAANVGAMQLSEFSAQLDEQCGNRQMDQIAQTLEAIRIAMEWLRTNASHQIENYLSSLSNQTRVE